MLKIVYNLYRDTLFSLLNVYLQNYLYKSVQSYPQIFFVGLRCAVHPIYEPPGLSLLPADNRGHIFEFGVIPLPLPG